MKKRINVTKSFLPPKEQYYKILDKIWKTNWVTNRGPLVEELEEKLRKHLKTNYLTLMTNGTFPIQIAIKALDLKGEIITTPFSYVATTSSIVWEGCKPVFVDIHPDYLTIDETKIESAINSNTSAILVTHVYGNPCNVEEINRIAKKYNLKVIYDAAHCFGVKYKGKSIFCYGDVSTCSFHATKIFHTAEGGGIFTNSEELHDSFFNHHNFGHKSSYEFSEVGVNGKMSELQAAMGLSVLPYMDMIINNRKIICDLYNKNLECSKLKRMLIRENTEWNYSYFPVIFESEKKLLLVLEKLNSNNIFPRRYFNPTLNKLSYVAPVIMPISDSVSKRILCLPLYAELEVSEVYNIIKIINDNL